MKEKSWISVEDRLPEGDESVLVYVMSAVSDYQCVAYHDKEPQFYRQPTRPDGWCLDCWEHKAVVTHWMPLPAPPASPGQNGEESDAKKVD